MQCDGEIEVDLDEIEKEKRWRNDRVGAVGLRFAEALDLLLEALHFFAYVHDRSLLYEACGRIVNPIYGSVGLMWSGSWQLCHNAVEAVLRGAPVTQMATDAAEAKKGPPYDIRHVNKSSGSGDLHRVSRFKRARPSPAPEELNGSLSHESSLSHQSEDRQSRDAESLASGGDADPALDSEDGEVELDLTLGLEPFRFSPTVKPTDHSVASRAGAGESGLCKMELRLDCLAS